MRKFLLDLAELMEKYNVEATVVDTAFGKYMADCSVEITMFGLSKALGHYCEARAGSCLNPVTLRGLAGEWK
jgi:hypothetical protein